MIKSYFFGAIITNDEEASSVVIIRMIIDSQVFHILGLLLVVGMMFQNIKYLLSLTYLQNSVLSHSEPFRYL